MIVVKYVYVLASCVGREKPKVIKDKMNVEMFHECRFKRFITCVCDFYAMVLNFVYLERKVICISLFDVLSITLKANKSIKTNFLKTNYSFAQNALNVANNQTPKSSQRYFN